MTYPTELARKLAKQRSKIEPQLAQLLDDAIDEIERLTQECLEQADIEAHRSHFTKEYNGG